MVRSLVHPGRHPGRFRFRPRRAYPSPPTTFVPTVAGVGPSGPIFVLSLESGAKVTLSWGVDIIKAYAGGEQRINTTGPVPRMRFEGNAYLLDGQDRDVRAVLQRYAPAGTTFLLALPYEALPLVADAVGTVVTVPSTASCDWAVAGQRCVVVGADGMTQAAVVQSTTATTITLGAVDSSGNLVTVTTLGTAGQSGGQVMPLVAILLDTQQGFSRYAAGVDLWSIKAQANGFGWAGQDRCGVGAQITTYTYGVPIDQSTIVEQDLLVWDRPNLSGETESDAMASLGELVDLGALPFGAGPASVPDWVRPVRYSALGPGPEWQWFKAFARQVLGRQKAWALSTNRSDLVLVSAAGATLKVQSSAVAGGGDYTAWYTSLAHRRLAITKSDGTVQYVAVTATPVNNGDGTLSLTLDAAVSGAVTLVSFLEQVRFDNAGTDDFVVTWDGAAFSVELQARASQETITPPSLFMYDTFIDDVFSFGSPPPTFELTVPASGKAIYIRITVNRSGLSFSGISVTGGAPFDGMLVTIAEETLQSFSSVHEDTTWPAADRLWFPGRNVATAGGYSYTFVFCAAVNRWVCIGCNI